MKTAHAAVIPLALLLGGCATRTGLPEVNAIPIDRTDVVVAEVKRQVSLYQYKVLELKQHPNEDGALVKAKRKKFVCGDGEVDFDLTSVLMTLTTTASTSASGTVGANLPIVAPGQSIGPSLTVSRNVDNTQELNFTLYPIPVKPNFTYTSKDSRSAISDALFNLRTSLIRGATFPGACLATYNWRDVKTDKGGSFKLGLTVTSDVKGGVDIKLAPVSANVSGEAKSVTGNTLTVMFQQTGIGKKVKPPHGPGLGAGIVNKPIDIPEFDRYFQHNKSTQ
jgi:hypothetical protein